jgi:hypothetical protein
MKEATQIGPEKVLVLSSACGDGATKYIYIIIHSDLIILYNMCDIRYEFAGRTGWEGEKCTRIESSE